MNKLLIIFKLQVYIEYKKNFIPNHNPNPNSNPYTML